MPITIQGIRLKSITVSDLKATEDKITGSYEIITSDDKVLATQAINGYGGMKIPSSPGTHKALNELVNSIKSDISATIGIE